MAALGLYVIVIALLVPPSMLAADHPTVKSNDSWHTQAASTSTSATTATGPAAAPAPAGTAGTPTARISPGAPTSSGPRPSNATVRVGGAPKPQGRAYARSAAADTIADFSFSPKTITIKAGETVTWHNQGPAGHSATADDGSFDTGVLARGSQGSHLFRTPGTYTYHCRPHPFMHGTVRVLAASAGSGTLHPSAGSRSSTHSSGADSAAGGPIRDLARPPAARRGSGRAPGSRLASTGLNVVLLAMVGVGLLCCGLGLGLCLSDHRKRHA